MDQQAQSTDTAPVNNDLADIAKETLKVETSPATEKKTTEVVTEAKDESEMSLDELPLPGDDAQDGESEAKRELPKYAQKKLAKKDRIIAQKEAEIAHVKAEAERLNQLMQQQRQQAPVSSENVPSRDDYASDVEYHLAVADYAQEIKVKKLYEHQQVETQKQIKATLDKKLEETNNKGSEKYEDYDDIVEPILYGNFPSNPAMYAAILDSKFSDDIMYFLGRYRKQAEDIANMNPVHAIKKIAEIEERFKSRQKNNITKAPRIPREEKGNTGSANHGKSVNWGKSDTIDLNEYSQWYKSNYGK